MSKQREYKLVPQFLKSVNGRTVDGVFSVAGVIDDYGDIVHVGSFAKTIAERGSKILHLWQHDFYSPPTAVIETLREIDRGDLPEIIQAKYPEATGGAMVTRTYIESARGDEILAAIKAGSPLQMSYGYDAIRYEFEELEDGTVVRHLNEQRLWETSDVLWGANEATTASKHNPSIPIETLLGQLDRWLTGIKEGRRNAGEDLNRINKIATLAIELGATAVVLAQKEDDEKSTIGRIAAKNAEEETEPAAEEETEPIVVITKSDVEEETEPAETEPEPEDQAEAETDETADPGYDSGEYEDEILDTEDERQAEPKMSDSLTFIFADLDLLLMEI